MKPPSTMYSSIVDFQKVQPIAIDGTKGMETVVENLNHRQDMRASNQFAKPFDEMHPNPVKINQNIPE